MESDVHFRCEDREVNTGDRRPGPGSGGWSRGHDKGTKEMKK